MDHEASMLGGAEARVDERAILLIDTRHPREKRSIGATQVRKQEEKAINSRSTNAQLILGSGLNQSNVPVDVLRVANPCRNDHSDSEALRDDRGVGNVKLGE